MQYEYTHPGFPFLTYINSEKRVNMTDLCVYMKQKANARSSVYDIIINSLYLCIK